MKLKDAYDRNILAYIASKPDAGNIEGGSTTEKTIGYGSGNDYTPLDALNRLSRILDDDNVPTNGRWFVANPEFYEALGKEVGTLVKANQSGMPKSLVLDKGVLDQMIHGFVMFKTNNAPRNANGRPILLAGHVGAVATDTTLINNETLRNPKDFGNLFRGLHVFGRRDLRPTSLAAMHATIGNV
jgi:hypothetical protein